MPVSARLWQARLFSAAEYNCTCIRELCLLEQLATARRILQPSPYAGSRLQQQINYTGPETGFEEIIG